MPGKKAAKGRPAKAARSAKKPTTPKPTARPYSKTAPKAEGDAPVQAYIRALPGWQQVIARRVDAVIAREVPGVVKAVKWHSPIYGVAGKGWFASMGGFKAYVKVNFFDGARLRPVPPGGEGKTMRYWDVRKEEDLDERQLAEWVRQAAELPGWGTV